CQKLEVATVHWVSWKCRQRSSHARERCSFATGAAVAQVPAAQRGGLLLRIEAGAQLPLSLGGKGSEPLERVAHGVLKGATPQSCLTRRLRGRERCAGRVTFHG